MNRTGKALLLALFAGTTMTGFSSGQQTFPEAQPGTVPAGSLNGSAAIRQLADRLGEIAARNNMTPEALATLLRSDFSTYITPDGRVLNVCPLYENDDQGDSTGPAIARGGIDLNDFLDLESNPGAPKTVYLDFDGHHSVNDGWGHNIVFPAWDRSGNPAVFTDAEKQEIIDTWLEVVEDHAVFSNLNVTTKDPGLAALTKSSGADTTFGIRVVMTQATDGFGNGIGGVAYLNSFDESIDTPCFGFNKGLNAGPQTASHEAGHTYGLQHDGLNGSTYHPGSTGGAPTWGPIMGAPFGRQLVQWSNGDYPGSTSTQQDFNVITSSANGITIAADDHPNGPTGGTSISPDSPITGLITSRTDTDAFSFTAFGGDVTIDLTTASVGPTMDTKFVLYRDTPFAVVDDFSPTGDWNASKTYPSLPAGNYTVVVDGTFETKTNGPVSDYGSVGTYTITMSQSQLLLNISFITTPPTLIAPDTATPLSILIEENDDTLVGTPTLSYQRAGDASPTSVNLSDTGGGVYSGSLPEFDCGDDPMFWVSAEGALAGVVSNPFVGAYQAMIGTGVSVIDNGETDIGWTVSGNASDGQWQRAIPANFGRSDPAADFDGSGQCWVTDNGESNSDVDGGATIMTSPVFDFSNGGTVSYAYWMNDETNTIGAEDYFRVEISTNGGSSWSVARNYTAATSWRTDTIDVGAEFGNTSQLRIRFAAADNDPGDVLECAVDAIDFESFECTQENDCVADANGDGVLSPADFTAWVAAFNAMSAACDQNGDGACTPADFTAWVANFNAGCN